MRPTVRSSAWLIAAVMALVFALYGFPLLLDIPLLDPDEGRHAAMAQQMVESGDWVTPRYMDQPFFDKPPLFFWAQAISLRWFSMSQEAVRLPGMLFGLLGNLTTALVAWRLFGRRAGMAAGLIHATMALPLALVQAAVHDVALVPWVNLSLLAFWESANSSTGRRRFMHAALAGLWLGLAVLTKGLIGVAIVGVTYGLYLLAARKLSFGVVFRGAMALGIAAAMAAPWFIVMSQRNPGYAHNYFVERHWLGYLTTGQPHGESPWWYYLPLVIAGGLPWLWYLPAVGRLWREGRCAAPATSAQQNLTFAWLWLVGSLLFLSAGHSKLVTYLLPVFPSIALLAGALWGRILDGESSVAVRRAVSWVLWTSCPPLPLLPPAVLLMIGKIYHLQFSPLFWALTIVFSLSCLLPLVLWRIGRPRATLATVTTLMAVGCGLTMTGVLAPIAPQYSGRDLAYHMNRHGVLPPQVVVLGQRIDSVLFYLDPALRREMRSGQIRKVTEEEMAGTNPLPSTGWLAMPERCVPHADGLARLAGASFVRVGDYRVYGSADVQNRVAQGEEKGSLR